MKAILKAIKSIATGFTALLDFLFGIISDLVYVVGITGDAIIAIPSYFGWLPDEFLTVLLTIFSIVVIYKLLGREG